MRRALAAIVLGACAAWSAPAVLAQAAEGAGATPAIREAIRNDKRGLVERNMKLTPEEAKKFWPIYDEYQRDLDKIVERQNRVVLDYLSAGDNVTDANASRLAKELLAADADEQRLRERNFAKLSKAIPAKKAARYLQIENKIRTLVRFDMAERIQLVR
jgi:Spy/CpxP family protein refolding chaperone